MNGAAARPAPVTSGEGDPDMIDDGCGYASPFDPRRQTPWDSCPGSSSSTCSSDCSAVSAAVAASSSIGPGRVPACCGHPAGAGW
ncbi:protein of unknown function [Blastococcus saxobsidens DD2]|uniref:Uncharacterized protein n=1 Tax=Blastococcus saxobsidens (strain DD2) TaxID=1146883 RepID=H6RKN2_BLASD|nr:protein of unknown function [Blastococcus saxobsidens DD2]